MYRATKIRQPPEDAPRLPAKKRFAIQCGKNFLEAGISGEFVTDYCPRKTRKDESLRKRFFLAPLLGDQKPASPAYIQNFSCFLCSSWTSSLGCSESVRLFRCGNTLHACLGHPSARHRMPEFLLMTGLRARVQVFRYNSAPPCKNSPDFSSMPASSARPSSMPCERAYSRTS